VSAHFRAKRDWNQEEGMERRGFLGALSVLFSTVLSLNLPERKTPREPSQVCLVELPRANFLKAQQS
jgi:hypothetical protein